jgi:hypothetical protein
LVAAVAVLPLLTACVQPTTGPLVAPVQSGRDGFRVRVVTTAPAAVSAGGGGYLDRFSPGSVAVVEGWSRSEDATLVVVTPVPAQLIGERRYLRRDVDRSHPDVGFRLVLRSRVGNIARVCVLAQGRDGQVQVMQHSDRALCP